jgi:hypothetical protein
VVLVKGGYTTKRKTTAKIFKNQQKNAIPLSIKAAFPNLFALSSPLRTSCLILATNPKKKAGIVHKSKCHDAVIRNQSDSKIGAIIRKV